LLSLILNYIYIKVNNNEWFYNLTDALLLLITGVIIFFIIGLNPTIESYLITRFEMTIDPTKYSPETILELKETLKAIYNMFMYWLASAFMCLKISFSLMNNYRKSTKL